MRTAAPEQRDGGETAKEKSTGPDSFIAAAPVVQAPDQFRPVGDVADQMLARLGRRAGLFPRVAATGGRS